MLRRIPRGTLRNTRGRAGRYPLLVRLLHSLLRAGLSRRTDFRFAGPDQNPYTPTRTLYGQILSLLVFQLPIPVAQPALELEPQIPGHTPFQLSDSGGDTLGPSEAS